MECERELTDDAKTMLGDPRKALVAMALPMIVATIVQSANNIIDAVWVSGLGTAALAATGVAFPFFFIVSLIFYIEITVMLQNIFFTKYLF